MVTSPVAMSAIEGDLMCPPALMSTDMEARRSVAALPDLLTRQELAAFTGISVQTFARWAVDKGGPRITKLGHAVRYRKADVLAWLEASAA